jgi:hypothetical protein
MVRLVMHPHWRKSLRSVRPTSSDSLNSKLQYQRAVRSKNAPKRPQMLVIQSSNAYTQSRNAAKTSAIVGCTERSDLHRVLA